MKNFENTKLAGFLEKAKDIAVGKGGDIATIAAKAISGNIMGAIGDTAKLLKGEDTPQAKELLNEFELQKMEIEKDYYEIEAKDRQDARKLYMDDSIIQKIFSIVFLLGYGWMCYYMLEIIQGESQESELFKTMVTMIFTGTSAKLNTIVDFLFGGSASSK